MSDIFGGPPEDEGFEGGFDPFGYPEDYAEVEGSADPDPYGFWFGDEPENWWYDDVTLINEFGEEITMPANEWYEAALNDDEISQELFNMDSLDIIHELEDYGLWDADDWEVWREYYGEQ